MRAWIKVGTHQPAVYIIDERTIKTPLHMPRTGCAMSIRKDEAGYKSFRVSVDRIEHTGKGPVIFASKL